MPETDQRSGVPGPAPGWLLRLAAGLEAGAVAAACVLVWFGIHSHLVREPWWSKFNVAAAPFFGDRVFYLGFGRATLAGAALLFLVYSAVGILYALLAGGRGTARALLLGALWLTCWHLFSQRYLWPHLDPAAPPYFPASATAPAHAAAAVLLARLPAVSRRLRALCEVQETDGDAGGASPALEIANSGGCASGECARQEGGEPSRPIAPDC